MRTLQQTREAKIRERETKQELLKNIHETLIEEKLSFQNKERDLRQNAEEIQRTERKLEFLLLEEKKLSGAGVSL